MKGDRRLPRRRFLELSASLAAYGCAGGGKGLQVPTVPGARLDAGAEVTRLAFGSCCEQNRPAPIWDAITDARPDAFLFMGDNVYANAEEERELVAAYRMLADSAGYRRLREVAPVLATWDDHDYGRDDAGAEYPLRDASQRVMLDFFADPADSPRRHRPGVYTAYTLGPVGRRVQVVLLDTRYFRGEMFPFPGRGSYRPNEDPSATILGAAQWQWLEQVRREPAELRVVVSSIQLVSDEHPYERWGNFPHERARILQWLSEAGDVVVLSGDRHRAEISAMPLGTRTLVDVTSSSLNMPRAGSEPNAARIGDIVDIANFGVLEIDWPSQRVALSVRDEHGVSRLSYEVPFGDAAQPWDDGE